MIAGSWVVGLLFFPGGADAAKRPACEVPRSKTYLANEAVRVFTTRHRTETSIGSAVDTVLRACFRRHGRAFRLASRAAVDTAGFEGAANIRLSGRHVAFTVRSCDRHGMFCAGGVRVWDVRTRRQVRSSDGTWASDLELHPNGSVAWITAPLTLTAPATDAVVRVNDRAGERTLATGAIAADSLALGGSMLSWTAAGRPTGKPTPLTPPLPGRRDRTRPAAGTPGAEPEAERRPADGRGTSAPAGRRRARPPPRCPRAAAARRARTRRGRRPARPGRCRPPRSVRWSLTIVYGCST